MLLRKVCSSLAFGLPATGSLSTLRFFYYRVGLFYASDTLCIVHSPVPHPLVGVLLSRPRPEGEVHTIASVFVVNTYIQSIPAVPLPFCPARHILQADCRAPAVSPLFSKHLAPCTCFFSVFVVLSALFGGSRLFSAGGREVGVRGGLADRGGGEGPPAASAAAVGREAGRCGPLRSNGTAG